MLISTKEWKTKATSNRSYILEQVKKEEQCVQNTLTWKYGEKLHKKKSVNSRI